MTRAFLGVVGLSALLTACSVDITTSVPPVGTSTSLSITNINSFSSTYALQADAFDQNNQFVARGTSIICDNRNTPVDVDVSWSGGLQRIGIQFKGVTTGGSGSGRVFGSRFGSTDFSGRGIATVNIGPNLAPLHVESGLSAQGIVPTPVAPANIRIKGYTYVQVVGEDSNGNISNLRESVTAIPVADCS